MISTELPAYKYLIETRKLNEETINKFHLGYYSANGETYIGADFEKALPTLDRRFNHSTLFPIFDLYGECIAVSARPLGPTKTKYLNTSYEKADHLYGLNVTWKECLKHQTVYVVEGNLSLLTPWQHGIRNIVALLGSKISHTQLCLLSRFVKKVVFCSDGDLAGSNLITKIKESIPTKFYDSDLQLYYVQLPDKMDPDDYIKQFGKESFLSLPEQELKYGR